MNFIKYCNLIIEYSFYSLFLLVPLVFSGATSELFELPKMWLTFGLTILIVTAWLSKMILQSRVQVQRTPLDIPILLFLVSQIVSTIFSLDPHVSLWGFYSRFNGGLLSIASYILLYYAFVSNLTLKHVLTTLKISLITGFIVAAWGIPSHFGMDPTCYIFRGTFDTTCWTEAFRPTIRIFSTLGQPAWLAAYMSILIPLAAAFALINSKKDTLKLEARNWKFVALVFLALMFYAGLNYTDTRGGFIGFWIANFVFWVILLIRSRHSGLSRISNSSTNKPTESDSGVASLPRMTVIKYFLLFNLLFLLFNFFQGVPISQISRFTLPELVKSSQVQTDSPTTTTGGGALGGTDSGQIRLLVWRGAIDAWKDHPVIGTGVETFAYAYYKYKPLGHNLTTEWDFLYNKAHNEYLNYLTTTGIFGLGSYLSIIGTFLLVSIKKFKVQSSKLKVAVENSNSDKLLLLDSNFALCTLHFALIAGYISIIISNFFGFSVVIINLYFFLIPAFVFILSGTLNPEKTFGKTFGSSVSSVSSKTSPLNRYQIVLLIGLSITSSLFAFSLHRYWRADLAYSNGSNLNKGNAIQEAYPFLEKAVSLKNNEPLYKDELSLNMTTIAAALYLQNDASSAAQLKDQAIALNDEVVREHPNNVVLWKNRVRLFYTLVQGDKANEKVYFGKALDSIQKAQELAPNDAKISYNLGILVGQTGDIPKAIQILENTIKLKPNYRDAYFALGLFYDETGQRPKAIQTYEYILKNIDPEDEQAKEALESWKK